jgi:hypothetical protein
MARIWAIHPQARIVAKRQKQMPKSLSEALKVTALRFCARKTTSSHSNQTSRHEA